MIQQLGLNVPSKELEPRVAMGWFQYLRSLQTDQLVMGDLLLSLGTLVIRSTADL